MSGAETGAVTVVERWWLWQLRAACEIALARYGGEVLVADARREASWYADMLHPWDGHDEEPATRVHAWLSILLARLFVAEVTRTGRTRLDR